MGKRNIVWNDYISQAERFADFFNGVVFQGKRLVCPEHLLPLDSKLWRRCQEKNSYHEYVCDSAKVWEYEGMKYILGLEPEDSPHFALPVKYMNYESIQYDRQYRGIAKVHRRDKDLRQSEYISGFSEADRLMSVITIGVYLGRKEWSGFTRLTKMQDTAKVPEEVRKHLLPLRNDFRVNLFDVHTLETSDIFMTDLREVFGFLKRQEDKGELKKYVERNERFRHLEEDAYNVLVMYSESRELELRKEEYKTKEGMNMCLAIQEMIEDGRIEGQREGMSKGWADGVLAMNELIHCLIEEGRTEDLLHSSRDIAFQEKLMAEYGIKHL